MFAAEKGFDSLVEFLLQTGCSLEMKDKVRKSKEYGNVIIMNQSNDILSIEMLYNKLYTDDILHTYFTLCSYEYSSMNTSS